jgi:hypothetical protein
MANTLEHDIAAGGSWQADVFKWMENVNAILNELQTDHPLYVAQLNALVAKLDGDGGITDTDYVAKLGASGSVAPTAAALTNSTALKLTKG